MDNSVDTGFDTVYPKYGYDRIVHPNYVYGGGIQGEGRRVQIPVVVSITSCVCDLGFHVFLASHALLLRWQ